MAGKTVKRGSVILVRYPFTDLTNIKVRPALMLTPDILLHKLDDILCLFISSVIPVNLLPTDLLLDISNPYFAKTGLKYPSVFRAHKLALLQKSFVLSVLGEMDYLLMKEINGRLKIALGL